MTSSDYWDAETAEHYDESSAFMYAPELLDPAVNVLAELAGAGPVLELAIGTGRVAIPLAERGIQVFGIELSAPMVDVLNRKRPDLPVRVGDMADATAPDEGPAPGEFTLVFVVWNSIGNLRTQAEQVACFRNAARHLAPGGRFVIELWIPGIRRFPPGQSAVPFHVGEHHVGFDTYDMATQQGTSHHYTHQADGVTYGASNFRYIWPAECDLMAQLAGLEFESRAADWRGSTFTGDSENHVSVWRKPFG
ncbi:MAG: class I SAM-dependent methyltransferase [Nocardioides sp.]